MNKLLFDTLAEAKEFVTFTKSKGYTVSEPVKVKRPKAARKVYDLNGKPVTSRWQVMMGTRGVGKRGGEKADKEEKEVPDSEFHTSWDKYLNEWDKGASTREAKRKEKESKEEQEIGEPTEWDKAIDESIKAFERKKGR